MARQLRKLSARAVATLAKPGRHSDGGGLYLDIDKAGRRRWIFISIRDGKRREMGLGGSPTVSLAAARERADEARKLVAAGVDPIEAKREAGKARAAKPTFGEVANQLIEAKESEWRNEKHRYQWRQTLGDQYVSALRPLPVDEVDTEAVLGVLQPIWLAKPETASRLRGRIEAVLDFAKARKWRSGENPAQWRGHLDKLLAKRQKLARGHHRAMPYPDVPEFVGRLRERAATAALALEFCILTAARSGEVLGARWAEIDLEGKVWTVPAARMKTGREHRAPLTARALTILEKLAEAKTDDFVFSGQRPGKPLSNMSMIAVLKRMGVDVTPHGFRSSFRDWAGDQTHFAREIAEAALAHTVGDEVERAYRRGDALEKRRGLMEAWAGFCEPKAGSNVVSLPSKKIRQ